MAIEAVKREFEMGMRKALQAQIEKELRGIECFETALSELRSKQAEIERAADALRDILMAQYRLVEGLRDLLKATAEVV